MKMLLAVLCCLVFTLPCLAQTKNDKRGKDEVAIREVVAKYVDARERIDPKATEALFTADADQLVSSGEWRKGREDVVAGSMASSRSSSGKRTITLESIRFVSNDVVIADGRYELTGQTPATNRSMWATLVLKREGKSWRITAIRNMLPAPSASR
ncbi:MAG: YybH family protein [Blastocatellia bacterium]